MTETGPEKQIGKRIAALRGEHGWSQQKLADEMRALGGRYANWRQGMIDKTERGARPLRVNEMFDLASVLGIAPELLLEWEVSAEVLDGQIEEMQEQLHIAEVEHERVRGQLDNMNRMRVATELAERHWADRVARAKGTIDVLLRLRKNVQGRGSG